MKDIWLLVGTKRYQNCTPVKFCEECGDERDVDHTFCFECGGQLTKALRGPEVDITSEYLNPKPQIHRIK